MNAVRLDHALVDWLAWLARFQLRTDCGLELRVLPIDAPLIPGSRPQRSCLLTPARARALFPELSAQALDETALASVSDDDSTALSAFGPGSLDYVCIDGVLEASVNPIRLLACVDRLLRPGGLLLLSVADKRFGSDRYRPLSDSGSLRLIYRDGRIGAIPADYLDVARYIHPETLVLAPDVLAEHLQRFQARRERLNVWTGEAFQAFVHSTLDELALGYTELAMVPALSEQQWRHFCLLHKRAEG